jgi:hypothetical protein
VSGDEGASSVNFFEVMLTEEEIFIPAESSMVDWAQETKEWKVAMTITTDIAIPTFFISVEAGLALRQATSVF